MKKTGLLLIMVISLHSGFSQTNNVNQKILDSVSRKAIYYLQQKQTDSLYSIGGKRFKEQLSQEDFKNIMEGRVFPLNDFKNVAFVKTDHAINKYKVDGSPELQLLIGLDRDNKLETFLIQPFSDN
ncbi:MAG TPA: hypothetical protein VG847_07280 [Chitinophagaceae bacterium]|nr:hypothetical protein [Chitinophagaceae bacterium]